VDLSGGCRCRGLFLFLPLALWGCCTLLIEEVRGQYGEVAVLSVDAGISGDGALLP
jgi:hypothetical protein